MQPTPSAQRAITSADIKLGLKRGLAQGHQVFFEVGDNTGTRVQRHADAVAIGIWPSTGHQILGFEIKVSRNDFATEMKNPQKSWPVMRYCHRWSLVTPPGLVKSQELPPNWGLQTFDGKILRTVKQAPLLTPEPITMGFVAALVRRAGEVDANIIGAAVEKAQEELREKHKIDISERLAQHRDRAISEGQEAVKVVAALKQQLGDVWLSSHNVGEIAQAIKVLEKMGVTRTWNSIHALCETLLDLDARLRRELTGAGFEFDPAVVSDRAAKRKQGREL